MRRRGGQKRGIGSETRRSPREHRERRVDDVIDARSRSRPVAGTPSRRAAPKTLSRRRYKAEGARTIVCGDDCRRAGGTRAARKGADTRRPSVSDPETGPNAHLEDSSAVSGDERRGRSRDKRVASRERGTTVRNEQRRRNGARFFCRRSRRIFKKRSVSTAGRTIRPSSLIFFQNVRSSERRTRGREN